MNYRTQSKKEFDFLIDFGLAREIEVKTLSATYNFQFPILKFEGGSLSNWNDRGMWVTVPLSEFIKAMEDYKPPIKIMDKTVVFNKGCIEVGDIAISNQLVRDIVKNLID